MLVLLTPSFHPGVHVLVPGEPIFPPMQHDLGETGDGTPFTHGTRVIVKPFWVLMGVHPCPKLVSSGIKVLIPNGLQVIDFPKPRQNVGWQRDFPYFLTGRRKTPRSETAPYITPPQIQADAVSIR